MNGGDSITLTGIAATDIDASDFTFAAQAAAKVAVVAPEGSSSVMGADAPVGTIDDNVLQLTQAMATFGSSGAAISNSMTSMIEREQHYNNIAVNALPQ